MVQIININKVINPLSANPNPKNVPTNYLSMFDHFVGLALEC